MLALILFTATQFSPFFVSQIYTICLHIHNLIKYAIKKGFDVIMLGLRRVFGYKIGKFLGVLNSTFLHFYSMLKLDTIQISHLSII